MQLVPAVAAFEFSMHKNEEDNKAETRGRKQGRNPRPKTGPKPEAENRAETRGRKQGRNPRPKTGPKPRPFPHTGKDRAPNPNPRKTPNAGKTDTAPLTSIVLSCREAG
jgi:hypothetical protein